MKYWSYKPDNPQLFTQSPTSIQYKEHNIRKFWRRKLNHTVHGDKLAQIVSHKMKLNLGTFFPIPKSNQELFEERISS